MHCIWLPWNPYFMKLGSHREICGTKVIITRPTVVAAIKGSVAGMTLWMGRPPICAAMYMFMPRGGVIMPMEVAQTMMAPRCTRETPYYSAMGARMGASTITAGEASTKQPVISIKMITKIRKTVRLVVSPNMKSVAMVATCSRASTKENAQELATISITLPVLFMAPPSVAIKDLKFNSR